MKLPGFTAEYCISHNSHIYGKDLPGLEQNYKVILAVPKGGGGGSTSNCATKLADDQKKCDDQYDIDLKNKDPKAEDNHAICTIEAESAYNRCRRGTEAGPGKGIIIV
jgi:hypothetical protein